MYRGTFGKQLEHLKNGIVTFPDIIKSGIKLTPMQKMQVDCSMHGTTHIDKDGLREFLGSLSYPIYHLDFETMQLIVPPFDGTRSYQQIPFQYSLHIEHADGKLEHSEFLGDSVNDPRRALAEQLCKDIPENAGVTAYNKKFECLRIEEMAAVFPNLADRLMNIKEHIVDLLTPFQKGCCYYPAMGGGISIKAVLPALFPDNPELDYHNLVGAVHNGGEAMDIYPKIATMTPTEQHQARESLLRYCELDTYAMVKVLEKLRELAK